MGVFTHLHVASGFSARYGASHPRALERRAADGHQRAMRHPVGSGPVSSV